MDDYTAQLLLSVVMASVSLVRTVLTFYAQVMVMLAALVLVMVVDAYARE